MSMDDYVGPQGQSAPSQPIGRRAEPIRAEFFVAPGDELSEYDLGQWLAAFAFNVTPHDATVVIKPSQGPWQSRVGCPLWADGARPDGSFAVLLEHTS